MKFTKLAFIAALVPAIAIAKPNRDQNKQDPDTTDIESETFEWSTGHARLGLMVMSLTPELRAYFGAPKDSGLLVARVAPNSPAARAGVRVGDVITKVDDNRIQDATDIMSALSDLTENQKEAKTVAVEVIRDRNPVELRATLRGHKQHEHQQHQDEGNRI